MIRKIIYALLLVSSTAYAQQEKSASTVNNGSTVRSKDRKKNFENMLQKANAGDAKAMNATAIMYQNGMGVDKNFAEAIKWFEKSAMNGYHKAYVNLGNVYRTGDGTNVDFEKAYIYFSKASELNNPTGWYSQGYMLYKGLGCTQDYTKAYQLFRKGVSVDQPACMYFAGLCLRNGYGVTANLDSAKYWLTKSAKFGYTIAREELNTKEPENPFVIVGSLAQKIKTATNKLSKNKYPVNQYSVVKHSLPAEDIEGGYEGYLIRYDWSGKKIVNVFNLALDLNYTNNKISGQWIEKDDSISIPLNANLTKNGLVFKDMQYRKKDHYNNDNGALYDFENANLQLIKSNDTTYLTGNLQLYKPNTKEPEKPLQVVLIRKTSKGINKQNIQFTNEDGTALKTFQLNAYPNPFVDVINLEFELTKESKVFTQILTIDGKTIYTTPSVTLRPGNYLLPLKPKVTPGTYVVRLITGNEIKTAKLIKQ